MPEVLGLHTKASLRRPTDIPVAIGTRKDNNTNAHDNLSSMVQVSITGLARSPIEAANSLTAFFADGDDEAKMMSNIHVLTESSERVLDLERSSVIHMTEHRLR